MPKVQATGGGGTGRGRRGRMVAATALAEINVVPLVDVMLVLLIIFMVAAPMMTRGLDVNLPVARRSQSLSSERIFVTIPLSFGKDNRVQLDEELIRVDVLGERMRQALQGKSDKSVYLRADGAVTVQQTMTVMDALKTAGVEKVGLVSRLPGSGNRLVATPAPTYAMASGMPERRSTGPDGFKRMIGMSLAIHGVLIVAVALSPSSWRTRQTDPREVMTISLGGAPGPRAGGLTSMAGRPVQQAVPPKPEDKPTPIAPPAAKPPEMVEPTKTAPKQAPRPVTPPETATEQGRAKTPSTGARVSEGQAKADTGVVSDSIGLSTGGGGTGGQINLGNFCCPAYVAEMLQIIHRNWRQQQGARGATIMRFVIDRQGTLSEISVARTSGNFLLDQAATRALTLTKLPPLPREYTNPALTVNLEFNFTQ